MTWVDGDQQEFEKNYNAPMPWIGVYIAAASLVCTLAMATDVYHGIRHRKFWFPCKYFTLNAASLTVIAIAMKLPVDLNNPMPRRTDQSAKLSSSAFMCIMIANILPSLGPMNNIDLLMNVTAFGILIITIFVNVLIQISTRLVLYNYEILLLNMIMLSLLFLVISSALMVPTSKKILERKYLEMHRTIRVDEPERPYKVEKLIEDVNKYSIMAETSNPQFVLASSPTCSASGALSIIAAFIELYSMRLLIPIYDPSYPFQGESDYRWSVFPIFWIQTIGVVVGSIAPFFRLIRLFSVKLSLKECKKCLHDFKIENYWIQMLVDWKSSRLPSQNPSHIQCLKYQKCFYKFRNLILNILIKIQILIVAISKISTVFSVIILSSFGYCCTWLIRKLMCELVDSKDHEASEGNSAGLDLSPYVLQLQDEVNLANRTLHRITNDVQNLIEESEKKQSNTLKKLIEMSTGFQGVAKFENDQIPSLCLPKHPNSWSLVIVTLTSIVIALAKSKNRTNCCLLSGISEGLFLVDLIEETLDPSEDSMVNARKAANIVWLQVELYNRWMDEDLQNTELKGKTSVEILEWLRDSSKKILSESQKSINVGLADSSFLKVIAANSMYRISQSILVDHEGREGQTDEMLFDELCVMVADILSACLSNIQRVIARKCDANHIEKREANVKTAAQLVGQTKEIMSFLQQREIPGLDSNKLGYIDEWHAFLNPPSNSRIISSSSNQLLRISVE